MPPRHRCAKTLGPDPIDIHVGSRVRLRRILLGLSQSALAGQMGLSFQQVQKYEKGSNRVSASMLHYLANALDVPIGYFFDDMPEDIPNPPPIIDDMLLRRESLSLLRHYYGIADDLRGNLYELIRQMARTDGENP